MNPSPPPRDGTRFLLKHKIYRHNFNSFRLEHTGDVWRECRWVKSGGGSPAHFEPWCGDDLTHSTDHIRPEDVLDWLPLPDNGNQINPIFIK